jgi:hypothetical protein
MKTFVIDEQGAVEAVHDGTAESSSGTTVKTQQELAKAAEHWPASRLVEMWNQLPGVQPIRKFMDRKTAVTRIWKVLESLEPPAAPRVPDTPPTTANGPDGPSPDDKAPRANKTATVLDLLRRSEGATLDDIMAATRWQPHSVRGFISGTIAKRMGLKVESVKRADGKRVYSVIG